MAPMSFAWAENAKDAPMTARIAAMPSRAYARLAWRKRAATQVMAYEAKVASIVGASGARATLSTAAVTEIAPEGTAKKYTTYRGAMAQTAITSAIPMIVAMREATTMRRDTGSDMTRS